MSKGNTLVEAVFGIAVIALALSGVVSLAVKSLGVKTKVYDKKRSVELAGIVMETITADRVSRPESFWSLTNLSGQTYVGFDGYTYSVDYENVTTNGCGVGKTDCANVTVRVMWQSDASQYSEFVKFFTRR